MRTPSVSMMVGMTLPLVVERRPCASLTEVTLINLNVPVNKLSLRLVPRRTGGLRHGFTASQLRGASRGSTLPDMWEQWEVEGEARACLITAGAEDRPGSVVAVAHGLGIEVVRLHACAHIGEAALTYSCDRWRIYIRQHVPVERARYLVAHEIAEWWLQHIGYDGSDAEQAANRLGAAILAPREYVRTLLRRDRRFPVLARELRCAESCAALRAAEVDGTPTAVIGPRSVHVRGADWGWPCSPALRQLAAPSVRPPTSVRRVRLRLEPDHVAIVAQGA